MTRPRKIPIVEDAACALGASYRGRLCGTLGEVACFSFHPRKIVTTGEGGMITTNQSRIRAGGRGGCARTAVNGWRTVSSSPSPGSTTG